MANQISVNVYAIDGIPQPTSIGVSLPTKEVFVQEYEAQNNSNVHSLVTLYPNPNSGSKIQEFQVWETVGDLETAANTDGNSMFAADVYAINQSYFKNGGKSMLFPNEKPSIWPHSDGFVNSLVTFKGNDYYANQTKPQLVTSANENGIVDGSITLDPDSPEDVSLVWAGSQAEYDGLTPTATTLYFIIE